MIKRIFLALFFLVLFLLSVIAQNEKLTVQKKHKAYFSLVKEYYKPDITTLERMTLVEKIMPAIIDEDYTVRESFSRDLLRFRKEDFSAGSLSLIRQVFLKDNLVNFHLILLVGKLELGGLEKSILRFIKKNDKGEINRNLNYKSNEWAAHAALARLGDEEELDFLLSIIEDEPYTSTVYFQLLQYLAYAKQKKGIDYIKDKLFSEESYVYSPSEVPLKEETYLYAFRTLPLLATVIRDFPLPILFGGAYSLQDLVAARAWFNENNGQYEINDEVDFIPRQL